MGRRLIIFGNARLAELAHFYFTRDSAYDVVGFTVDAAWVGSGKFLGLPVVPFDEVQRGFPPDDHSMFVAAGYKDLNRLREERCKQVASLGFQLATYVSSKSISWDGGVIGPNSMVMEGCVVQPFVSIGKGVILSCGCRINHDSIVGDFCYFGTSAVACGGARFGERSFIGAGAIIRDGTEVGSDCIIGAGALIMKDVRDRAVHIAGNPAPYRLDSAEFLKASRI